MEDYAAYQDFGLTTEEGKLYYDGQKVRRFDDQMPANFFRVKAVGYYEETGTIDVRAVRENGKRESKLIGLEAASQDEFQKRVFVDSVSHWDENGEIDLYTVRDFKRKDKNGYGALSGFRIAAQEEFDADTEKFSGQVQAVERAE